MKRIILEAIALLSISLVLVSANPSNWFSAVDIQGNIVPTSTGVSKISLDLGDLVSTEDFYVSSNGDIIVTQNQGINITNILLTPNLYIPDGQQAYWLDRFTDLAVNFTVEDSSYIMPVILNNKIAIGQIGGGGGATFSYWRDVLLDSFGRVDDRSKYCFYQLWDILHLDRGVHSYSFGLYGRPNIVSSTIPVQIEFELELSV